MLSEGLSRVSSVAFSLGHQLSLDGPVETIAAGAAMGSS